MSVVSRGAHGDVCLVDENVPSLFRSASVLPSHRESAVCGPTIPQNVLRRLECCFCFVLFCFVLWHLMQQLV